MNIDIQNYGQYRLTSHGGRSFDLFNRESGEVYTIAMADWGFVRYQWNTRTADAEERCRIVEDIYRSRREI